MSTETCTTLAAILLITVGIATIALRIKMAADYGAGIDRVPKAGRDRDDALYVHLHGRLIMLCVHIIVIAIATAVGAYGAFKSQWLYILICGIAMITCGIWLLAMMEHSRLKDLPVEDGGDSYRSVGANMTMSGQGWLKTKRDFYIGSGIIEVVVGAGAVFLTIGLVLEGKRAIEKA